MTLFSVLTSLLLALLRFHEYVWRRKEKHKESVALPTLRWERRDFFTCTVRHKPVSPRASSSVSTSVMYRKSMHETIRLGSWVDTHETWYFPCDPILDMNQTSTLLVTHHVDEQLPQRLQENDENRWVMKYHVCFSDNASSYSPTLPSVLAHRSHTAFRTAAVARWITPFSGPNCFRQECKKSHP